MLTVLSMLLLAVADLINGLEKLAFLTKALRANTGAGDCCEVTVFRRAASNSERQGVICFDMLSLRGDSVGCGWNTEVMLVGCNAAGFCPLLPLQTDSASATPGSRSVLLQLTSGLSATGVANRLSGAPQSCKPVSERDAFGAVDPQLASY